jgi:hypothetical protein
LLPNPQNRSLLSLTFGQPVKGCKNQIWLYDWIIALMIPILQVFRERDFNPASVALDHVELAHPLRLARVLAWSPISSHVKNILNGDQNKDSLRDHDSKMRVSSDRA